MAVHLENNSLHFLKYQGAGNDFIFIDNRKNIWQKLGLGNSVPRLCHRRYGIGTDGIVLIQNHSDFDFQMVYFNADGSEPGMCGNGARCAVAFAKHLGIIKDTATFLAKDGPHEGRINPENNHVEIKMSNIGVDEIEVEPDGSCVLDTGVPHYVRFVSNLNHIDIVCEGRRVRYSEKFKARGINVNFVSTEIFVTQNIASNDRIKVFTYEKGVENETLACGTGATASAIGFFFRKRKKEGSLSVDERGVSIVVLTKGGDLRVSFDYISSKFTNVYLSGPANFVFEGKIG